MEKKEIDSLKKNPWLMLLYTSADYPVNPERLSSMNDMQQNYPLDYTLRTLSILESEKNNCSYEEYLLVKNTLRWAETSKGGSRFYRSLWQKKAYPLEIHNLSSARIFCDYAERAGTEEFLLTEKQKKIISVLISTHGLLGQYIRGEIPFSENKPLALLVENHLISSESLERVLTILNRAIIEGVSQVLYEGVRLRLQVLISEICVPEQGVYDSRCSEQGMQRLLRLKPSFQPGVSASAAKIINSVLDGREVWFAEIVLGSFSDKDILILFSLISKELAGKTDISRITFYPMEMQLCYDYDGKRAMNVYRQRIIEQYLHQQAEHDAEISPHVQLECVFRNSVLSVSFSFTPVCESLIRFCVEAERCGMLSYESCITLLFDRFGFRRDTFDRLANETSYLATMNAGNSTKLQLLEYAAGDYIMDVGCGGGVLLDLLEKKFPDRKISGTDISANVIENLEKRRQEEHHSWHVLQENLVDSPSAHKYSTIVFSSILHEVFSYTEYQGKKFNQESVKHALHNAVLSLQKGGRILIRDGIKTDTVPGTTMTIRFKTGAGMPFFRKYMEDFSGMPDYDRTGIVINADTVTADINYIREFLFTYTWGAESYSHEVQEQFGYFTKSEYESFLRSIGLTLIRHDVYLEKGYEEHLAPLVDWGNVQLPDSTCFFICELR
jgi:2-polyprenyl-3-methyl-5-hydroxy-6-metoxy-1,4-benzoquinol methylase